MIKLDYRNIIGEINSRTPIFVVAYIAKFCKIQIREQYLLNDVYYEDLTNLINNLEYKEINDLNTDSEEKDLLRVIKFISPFSSEDEWFTESIISGFDSMININIDEIKERQLIFGEKTNSNPLIINEIMAYKICLILNYNMEKITEFKEVSFFIENFFASKVNSLKNSLLHTINNFNKADLLKLYYHISNSSTIEDFVDEFKIFDSKKSKFELNPDILEITMGDFFNKKRIVSRIVPTTNYEAIITAAFRYDLNISKSSIPLKEIDNLKRRKYIPACSSFAKKYCSNKKFYKVSKNWSPQFSNNEIYTLEQLKNFALDEGFQDLNGISFNELNSYLKSTKNTFNFYFGHHPECNNTSTVFLTPLNELREEEIICFGIENKNSELYYISISELTEHFQAMKMFINPVNNEPIDDRCINKLKIYYQKFTIINGDDVYNFLKIISELEKIKKLLDNRAVNLKILLLGLDSNTLSIVENFFNKSMEMGLYMRGWKIVNGINFPLISEETIYENNGISSNNIESIYGKNFTYTNSQKVIDNTIIAFEEAKDILKTLPFEISSNIKMLQTLRFGKNEKSNEIMGINFKGTRIYHNETLIECMNNIYKGIDNPDSCIRTNSNWILYSSVWYMIIFGFSVPFQIDKIDDIQ